MNCPTAAWEEFAAVDDDNLYTALIMADKDTLKFVQSSKNINDVDTDDENEMNKATPVSMPFEMRNIMKACAVF
ncbi:hypothetical protein TNCV_2116201 [Trichonephila clavipes]|nr:hypothetical protein TNCV_2116201 [Trichonephila clavipes]